MSCGNPHATPCGEVLDAVSAYLDGELSEHDASHITEHFDECAPCLHELGIYQEVKVLVGRCCGGDPVPDEVRDRVVTRIRSITLTLRTESAESAESADS